MPINVAEEPRARVAHEKPDRDIITRVTDAHDAGCLKRLGYQNCMSGFQYCVQQRTNVHANERDAIRKGVIQIGEALSPDASLTAECSQVR